MTFVRKSEKGRNVTLIIPELEFGNYELQAFTVPKREVEIVEHAEGGETGATAGNSKYGDFEIKMIKTPGNPTLRFFHQKQDEFILGAGLNGGKFSVQIKSDVADSYDVELCVVKEIEYFEGEVQKLSNENIMAKVVLRPQRMLPVGFSPISARFPAIG